MRMLEPALVKCMSIVGQYGEWIARESAAAAAGSGLIIMRYLNCVFNQL